MLTPDCGLCEDGECDGELGIEAQAYRTYLREETDTPPGVLDSIVTFQPMNSGWSGVYVRSEWVWARWYFDLPDTPDDAGVDDLVDLYRAYGVRAPDLADLSIRPIKQLARDIRQCEAELDLREFVVDPDDLCLLHIGHDRDPQVWFALESTRHLPRKASTFPTLRLALTKNTESTCDTVSWVFD